MKRHLSVFAALAMSLVSSVYVPSLKASELDEKTIITTSQPMTVDGVLLPAGRYILKLQESPFSRSVVYIFNGEENRLITAVLANHAYRLEPTDRSAFSFYESSAGQPPALHTWFYPGETAGLEFQQGR
jgi:hypothetical protein